MTDATSKHIVLVCRKSPYGNSIARETIDIALAAGVYEQQFSMVFLDDGVWQLHSNQDTQLIGTKNHQKALSALPLYGIENIYVDEQALIKRKIKQQELAIEVDALSPNAISALLNSANMILNL